MRALLALPLLLLFLVACRPDCERDLHLGDDIAKYTSDAPSACDVCCDKTIGGGSGLHPISGGCEASYDCSNPNRPQTQCVEVKQLYVGNFGNDGADTPHNDGQTCNAIVLNGKVIGRYSTYPW